MRRLVRENTPGVQGKAPLPLLESNCDNALRRRSGVELSADPIPGVGPAYVESHLNPLLNVSHLNLPLRLDEVEVRPGRLVVHGSVYLPPTGRAR